MPGWKAYFQLAQTPRGLSSPRRMAATPPACFAAQALATGNDDLSGIAGIGCKFRPSGEGGGKCHSLVAQQPT